MISFNPASLTWLIIRLFNFDDFAVHKRKKSNKQNCLRKVQAVWELSLLITAPVLRSIIDTHLLN